MVKKNGFCSDVITITNTSVSIKNQVHVTTAMSVSYFQHDGYGLSLNRSRVGITGLDEVFHQHRAERILLLHCVERGQRTGNVVADSSDFDLLGAAFDILRQIMRRTNATLVDRPYSTRPCDNRRRLSR